MRELYLSTLAGLERVLMRASASSLVSNHISPADSSFSSESPSCAPFASTLSLLAASAKSTALPLAASLTPLSELSASSRIPASASCPSKPSAYRTFTPYTVEGTKLSISSSRRQTIAMIGVFTRPQATREFILRLAAREIFMPTL